MISHNENQVDDLTVAKHSLKILNRSNQSSFQSLSQLIEYNISDLSPQTLSAHKRRLYQLATEAHLNRVQLHFYGLEELRKKYGRLFREQWDSNNNNSMERELYELINTIQMQSNLSSRRYYIKVVN